MKNIRVTVTEDYLVPDDWIILNHPEDHCICLHGHQQYFLPSIDWMQRRIDAPGKFSASSSGTWSSADEEHQQWFFKQTAGMSVEKIRELK